MAQKDVFEKIASLCEKSLTEIPKSKNILDLAILTTTVLSMIIGVCRGCQVLEQNTGEVNHNEKQESIN